MNKKYDPLLGETQDEYLYRIIKNKSEWNLTWLQIAMLMKEHFNRNVSADYIRHEAYAITKRDKIEEIGIYNRILVVSDQHYPFNLPVNVLKDYVGKVDILVFNGDEEDCQSISKFSKKYRVPFVDEMIGTRQMIIDTINLIKPKKVIFNYGNHNERLINYFTDKIHEDLLQLMPKTNLDFIVDIGFWKHNHELMTKTFYEPLVNVFEDIEIEYTNNWWCRIGQTILTHPKAFKSGILGTVEKAFLHYVQLGESFDCIVMAHTHASGITRYGKAFLFESGCLCKNMGYANDGRMTKPQSNGFVYIVQDKDGNFIYDKSKLICL